MESKFIHLTVKEYQSFIHELVDIATSSAKPIRMTKEAVLDMFATFYAMSEVQTIPESILLPLGSGLNQSIPRALVILNSGTREKGLVHIEARHGQQFLDKGFDESRNLVQQAVDHGPTASPEVANNGAVLVLAFNAVGGHSIIAVAYENNGFIVTAHPYSNKRFIKQCAKLGITWSRSADGANGANAAKTAEKAIVKDAKWTTSNIREWNHECSPQEKMETVWLFRDDFFLLTVSEPGEMYFLGTSADLEHKRVPASVIANIDALTDQVMEVYERGYPLTALEKLVRKLRIVLSAYAWFKALGEPVYLLENNKLIQIREESVRFLERQFWKEFGQSVTSLRSVSM